MAKIPRDFHKTAINSKLRKNFLSFALCKRRILVCWIEARIRCIYILIFLYLEYTLGDIMWWREISFLWDSHNKLYMYISSHVRFRMIMEPANFLTLFCKRLLMMQNELSIRERTYEKCQTKSCISRVPLLYLFYALVITLVQASPFGHYSTPSCNWAVTVG